MMAEEAAAVAEAPVETAPEKPGASSERDPPQPTDAELTRLFGPDPDAKVEPSEKGESKDKEQPVGEEKPQDGDADFDAAFQALLTAGVPPSVLKNAKRADLVRWSQTEVTRAADIRSAFQERADLKKQVEKLSQEATAKPSEPSSGVPTEAADLKDLYQPLAEAFGYGPELEKPLAVFAEKLLAKAVSQIESKYADTIGELSGGSMAAQEMLLETTRAGLTESFPGLDDETAFYEKVIPKMIALAKTGAYADKPTARARAKALMEDASGLIWKGSAKAEGPDKRSVSRARDNGQPIVRSTHQSPKPMTSEAVAMARFMAREDGASDDEVARIR